MQPDMQCTLWPEGWWHHCCVQHDLGGTDLDLAWCVLQSAPNGFLGGVVAFVMLAGLILFRPIWKRVSGRN